MVRINLTYAKAHLSEVLNKVEAGQEVIITRHGKEIVRMSPARQPKQPIPLAKRCQTGVRERRIRLPTTS